MKSEYRDIIESFLKESEQDYVGLWQVIKAAKRLNPAGDDSVVRSVTLTVIRELITAGFEAGDPPYSSDGYRPWSDQSAKTVITRIEREWDALGHEPNIGDIVWFNLPAKGNV